jgi:hypothetical protein
MAISQGHAAPKFVGATDKAKGIKTPGIVEAFEYEVTGGKKRYKAETIIVYSASTIKKLNEAEQSESGGE